MPGRDPKLRVAIALYVLVLTGAVIAVGSAICGVLAHG